MLDLNISLHFIFCFKMLFFTGIKKINFYFHNMGPIEKEKNKQNHATAFECLNLCYFLPPDITSYYIKCFFSYNTSNNKTEILCFYF